MEGRRATDLRFAIQFRFCRGDWKESFLLLPAIRPYDWSVAQFS